MKSFLRIVLTFLILILTSFQVKGQLISVSKVADVSYVYEAGDVITYTITVTNLGIEAAINLVVNDPLLGGNMTLTSGDVNGNVVLDLDEAWIYEALYTVTQDVINDCGIDVNGVADGDGDIDNEATVNGEDTNGNPLATYTASVEVTVAIPAPIGNATQYVCDSGVTIDDLNVFNSSGFSDVYWFAVDDTMGTPLDPSILVVNGATYYAFQGIGSCALSLAVTVEVVNDISAPVIDSAIPIAICEGENITLSELPIFNTGIFDGVYWFSTADQVAGTELNSNTAAIPGVVYYAFEGIGNCAEALMVAVEEHVIIPQAYSTGNPINICESEWITLGELPVMNTGTFDGIYWFITSDQTLGTKLDFDTIAIEGVIYYAFQGIGSCAVALEVYVEKFATIPAPTGDSIIAMCEDENTTLGDLPVFNTSGFDAIYWFTNDSQIGDSVGLNTLLNDGDVYFAFQGIGDCAAYLEVEIELIPTIPAPIGDTEQYFCYEQTWTLNDVVVENTTGYTDIYWFDNMPCQGGEQIDPNTIINDGDVYFALQGINGCCPGALEVTIFIPDPHPAPTGDSDQYFTEGIDFMLADAVVYNTGTFTSIYWFEDTEQETEVSHDTIVEDGDVYYAFQAICACECYLVLPLQVTFHMLPIGVDENKESFFKLYPSPVKDLLTISLDKEISSLTVRITDTNGKLIYNENLQSQETDLKIDVSKLDSGVYILSLWADGKYQTNKIIIK